MQQTKGKRQTRAQDSIQGEERYQAFFRNSSEGIWRFEVDEPIPIGLSAAEQVRRMFMFGYLAEANLATAKMYGFKSVKSIVGLPLNQFMLESDPENTAYLEAFVASGYKLSNVESHEVDNAGNDKYFSNSLTGIVENECLVRVWGTQQDVTDRRRAVEALKRSEERLSLALAASSMGLWEWDVVRDELYWSDELKRLYGLKPSAAVDYDTYISFIHPGDRAHIQKTVASSMQTGEMYQFEHRIIWPDGSEHWLIGQGRAYLEDGKAVRMVGTSTNIDASKRANELALANAQLKTQRAQLLAVNKTKDEFIALASHQLRTPATAVKQYTSLLIHEFAGPLTPEQLKYVRVAFESNERQLQIISDLLKTAQLDSSRYLLEKKPYDLAKLIRSAAKDMATTCEIKNQRITLRGMIKAEVELDPNEIKLVLINLLENASKYSRADTEISVAMRITPAHAEVSVIDAGVGISKADSRRIFDKFTRVDNELSDTVTGTGFGLYWVKRIINLHGGTIKVKANNGVGSTFTVRLPR